MSTLSNTLTNPQAQIPLTQARSWGSAGAMHDDILATDAQAFLVYARSYPLTLEGAQAKFGMAIFDDMLRDACVAACTRKLKQEALSKDFRFGMPEGIAQDALTEEVFAFCNRCLDGMDTRIEDFAWQVFDYPFRGHVMAEIDWKDGDSADAGRDVLESVRIIPWDMYTIVLDAYGKFLGVIGRMPGRMPLQWVGPIMFDLSTLPGFVPYWKLFMISHEAKPGDLRGSSRLDNAYNPFRIKKVNWSNWYDYVGKFGKPKTFIELGATATAADPNKTPEEEWTERIANNPFDVLGLPKDSKVTFSSMPAGWMPYVEVNDACNKEIALGILGSYRSMLEAEHGSRADSETSQDEVDEDTDFLAHQFCAAFSRQVIKPLVVATFGKNAPCPFLMMHEDTDDFVDKGKTVGTLAASKFPTPSQHPQLSRKLGLEPPTPEEQKVLEERFRSGPVNPEPDVLPLDEPNPKKKKAV